ncbi:hypothetical protein CTI12_AA541700 [Artemisia annua]|uniref:Uncharacterized protein n=1 Tax=Artemisia annua TaxID=35608 RepID=A0A2U1L132_ARTAN|nr:hypothetical protein CTI12_AA541700 [Artemisia annua]
MVVYKSHTNPLHMISFFDVETKVLDLDPWEVDVPVFGGRGSEIRLGFLLELDSLKSFHVRLKSIVLDVDVEPSTTPWDIAKAYLFMPVVDPIKEIDWVTVETIIE